MLATRSIAHETAPRSSIAAGGPPIERPAATRSAVVVLVEDDPDHAELVARALEEHAPGLALVHLTDGEAALRYLGGGGNEPRAEPPPALVLLDMRLPGIDGAEVRRRLRQRKATRKIPVVLLTTADPGTEAENASDPATTWAVKPVDGIGFRRLIADLVREWVGPEDGPASGGRRSG